jgi:hypothetical protein
MDRRSAAIEGNRNGGLAKIQSLMLREFIESL